MLALYLQAAETPEAWEAMLEGLAALSGGIGAAVASGDLEPDQAVGLFGEGQLSQLLALCSTPAARAAVLDIAAALPDCETDVQARRVLTSTAGRKHFLASPGNLHVQH
jgi:hypothetical protein